MSTNTFTVVIDEIATMKAEEINIFGITAMILARFADKVRTWKELAKLHNASCVKCLVVSEYSDGRDGLNFRNELFNIQHNSDHELAGAVQFTTTPNAKKHAQDGVKRSTLQGVKLTRKISTQKLAKFYRGTRNAR